MTLATDQKNSHEGLSATSRALLNLREVVFDRWLSEVRRLIPAARETARPVLVNTLPMLYDNLAEALTPEYPRALATSHTNLGAAHGDERARMTVYGSDQVVHEYHLFRDVILAVCGDNDIALSGWERSAIDRSIDTAVRESVRAFDSKQEELRHRTAAALSHDMRTPLSVLHMGAKVIEKASSLESAKAVAATMSSNSVRLIEMVDQLIDALTFYQGATLPLQLTEFDMLSLAHEVRDDLAASGSLLELKGQSVVGFWCRNSVRRAIENLATNAMKYGDGGPVNVKVDCSMGRVMVSVHNAGKPVPAQQQESIFVYLRREQSTSREGWGIGLPFVQAVAEGHGGTVAVDSAAETGTTFVLDFPVDCRPFVK